MRIVRLTLYPMRIIHQTLYPVPYSVFTGADGDCERCNAGNKCVIATAFNSRCALELTYSSVRMTHKTLQRHAGVWQRKSDYKLKHHAFQIHVNSLLSSFKRFRSRIGLWNVAFVA